jgi:hypothetical protein
MSEPDRAFRARLPAAVYDLGVRTGVMPEATESLVRLTQTGRMKPRLDAPSWMTFTATQTISTRTCDFDWLARFGPLGMISVRDALHRGEGQLDVTALGVFPMARTPHSAALVRGELMRYLAEIVWAPEAIFLNDALRWRDDGNGGLTVTGGEGATMASVTLSLDGEGRVIGVHAPDRPRTVGATTVPTPWTGRFDDYRLHHGHWIPFRGEIAWELDGVPEVYWQGEIRSWEIG